MERRGSRHDPGPGSARNVRLSQYFGTFCFGFNHRVNLVRMLLRVGWAVVPTPQMHTDS